MITKPTNAVDEEIRMPAPMPAVAKDCEQISLQRCRRAW